LFNVGPSELWIILLIVLVLFGATRVPQLMRGIGQGIREFKSAVKDDHAEEGKDEGDKSSTKKSE
jgi:sec-independent protein translocase protein TatA